MQKITVVNTQSFADMFNMDVSKRTLWKSVKKTENYSEQCFFLSPKKREWSSIVWLVTELIQ